ncbi:glycoside hydrolase [Panus rudis PR-1116 ss-1]|nr:glycoside hydrolase [Panus rudis PR-1116 ss-1]
MAYYPDWTSEAFPPEKIDFNRLDWIDFAFAVPKQDFDLGWDGSEDAPMILDRLVGAAHAKGKRVKVSVGGWTGSKYFSQACSTPENRQILATNILAMYNRFDLDGIDIDWEYPGQRGDPQNVVSPGDSDNFLAFLKTLRQTLPPDAKITAATMTVPFVDEDENPMGDVSAFAKVLDWILVMNYDSWGSSSNPGPNAPLNDSCGNSTQSTASALSAIEAWTTAGFPTSQIVLGVPSYGYLSRSTVTRLRTRGSDSVDESEQAPTQNEAYHPLVTASRATSRNRLLYDYPRTRLSRSFLELTASNEDGGTDNGQIQFRQLVEEGILSYIPDSDVPEYNQTNMSASTRTFGGRQIRNMFTGNSGFTRYWDDCSNTPYLRSEKGRQVVSYDDPQSLEMKAMFANAAGLLGVNMFDIHGDTDHWDLTDAVRRGLDLV